MDLVVFMYEDDLEDKPTQQAIKTIFAVNPSSLILVRTKVDQSENPLGPQQSIDKVIENDRAKLTTFLGTKDHKIEIFAVSAQNIKNNKSGRYDWDKLKQKLTSPSNLN